MSTFEWDDGTGAGRLRGTLHAPGATPGDVLTVNANASVSPAPGGGSMPGALRLLGPFAFHFDDAGLNDGIAFYTPTIGDFLYDVFVWPTTPWDGTTPRGDVGAFIGGNTTGLFAEAAGPVVMTSFPGPVPDASYLSNAPSPLLQTSANLLTSMVPGKFVTADPLKFVVSEDGSAGGTDPGAAQGVAEVHIIVATPSAA